MRVIIFCHSIVSDWNHGNAHFLRGIVSELQSRGHEVRVYEPREGWSIQNLVAQHGDEPIARFRSAYPNLRSIQYDLEALDLDQALAGSDLVLVHEWNDHKLVYRLGQHRARTAAYKLLFHDTHHRSVTDRAGMAAYDLSQYDGVLAFGAVLRDIYLREGWARRAWVWHEAADTRVFHPIDGVVRQGDLIWIGNWGDGERSVELREFIFGPARSARLKTRVYGVRYPADAIRHLAEAGIEYAGWLPNYEVPRVLASFRMTLHILRRPYMEALPGIPTIRVFEALACGIPLICAPWSDVEGLFTVGKDFLVARNGEQMARHLSTLLHEPELVRSLAEHGRRTVLERHTCAHRVDELLRIASELGVRNCEAGKESESNRSLRSRL